MLSCLLLILPPTLLLRLLLLLLLLQGRYGLVLAMRVCRGDEGQARANSGQVGGRQRDEGAESVFVTFVETFCRAPMLCAHTRMVEVRSIGNTQYHAAAAMQ